MCNITDKSCSIEVHHTKKPSSVAALNRSQPVRIRTGKALCSTVTLHRKQVLETLPWSRRMTPLNGEGHYGGGEKKKLQEPSLNKNTRVDYTAFITALRPEFRALTEDGKAAFSPDNCRAVSNNTTWDTKWGEDVCFYLKNKRTYFAVGCSRRCPLFMGACLLEYVTVVLQGNRVFQPLRISQFVHPDLWHC